jgi:predicted short-subunit dehydrogenase-like oxidoreductase (DUF2520 family)
MTPSGRLGIGIVGAGNVGPVLGRALAGAGHAITGITAVGEARLERVEAMLPGVPVLDITEVVRRSELVIFAVPGSELPGLVHGLTETGAWQPGQLVLHTAAALGFGVFAPALAAGVIPIAFHPALVFTGMSMDVSRLHEATVAITAPAPVLPIGQALAVEIGAEPVIIAEADRAAYGEAVDAAVELSAAVVRQATEALRELGLDRPNRVIGGLVRAAVDEALLAAGRQDRDGPFDGEGHR